MALSIVSSVAQYLGGLLMQEAELIGGVSDQIEKIQNEMNRIQAYLIDAYARQDESAVGRNRISEMRDLAYDVEDAIDTYILEAKYKSFFNPKKYVRLHKIGKEIKGLEAKIMDITCGVATYSTSQGEGTSSTRETRQQLRQSYPHFDDEDVIGIVNDIMVLVAELINKEGPHLVSIAGMGGLGKTTLAKKIYNHDHVKCHFDCCAWSFISQQFQVRTILQEIIRKVSNPNEETRLETLNDGELKEKLYKVLEDKCYLVVLDDIWSTEAWDVLKPAFPKGKMGSKIMVTTRIKDVSLHVDSLGYLYEPVCLTEEKSWELFSKKAFISPSKNIVASTTPYSSFPQDVDVEKMEKLGREMMKKCRGLPLAIVVLGGMLAAKKSIHEWEMVGRDIGRYLNKAEKLQEQEAGGGGVSWILSLSYHNLPSYLKPCFLYLGIYPEHTEVHKRDLIQKWIAEGFVQGTTLTKEEIGEEYFVELINRSMVQVAGERSFRGKVKACRLHDLMRDVCLLMAEEENFLCTFDNSSTSTSTSTCLVESSSISNYHRIMRRHAIHFSCDSYRYVSMQQPTRSRRSPHLRAFSLWMTSNPDESIESIGTLKLVCKKFNFLRVLELEDVKIDSLPRAIGELIHLRYLKLFLKYNSTEVPVSIGNLRSLQFLILRGIERLPNVLWKMEQLTYCYCYVYYGTHNNKPLRVDGLKNLSTMILLGRRYMMLDGLTNLTNLRSLSLSGFGNFDWTTLSHCRSLWKLCLYGQIVKLSKSDEFPPNLTKLWLNGADLKEDPIPTLEMLPNLECLVICLGGRIIKYYFSTKGFGRLQYLQLYHIHGMEELEVEKGALPCLVGLQIDRCFRLRKLPEEIRFITGLKKLEVIGMPNGFNERLQKDVGDDWHKIQHIPSIIIRRSPPS
ncbi:probable disease resistance protein RF45 [Macadamia integrifolia]|uniref:probable disease resistance protein RF45 n=1 Tax=Macadamia integrifolia TaxID=60698 RepID=UPI001C4E700E|nr:probable disease resistance protein RF45 [Macadamia integrifolia]